MRRGSNSRLVRRDVECSLAPQYDAAQGDCDGPQHLTTKSKIPKARTERAHYN